MLFWGKETKINHYIFIVWILLIEIYRLYWFITLHFLWFQIEINKVWWSNSVSFISWGQLIIYFLLLLTRHVTSSELGHWLIDQNVQAFRFYVPHPFRILVMMALYNLLLFVDRIKFWIFPPHLSKTEIMTWNQNESSGCIYFDSTIKIQDVVQHINNK